MCSSRPMAGSVIRVMFGLTLLACGPKREICEYGRPIKSSPRQPDLNVRRCPKGFGDAGVVDAPGSAR